MKPFTDLLVYDTPLPDGTILGKDGELISCYAVEGHDLTTLPDEELERYNAWTNQALCMLDDGWTIHCDLISEETTDYNRRRMLDLISQQIEDERASRWAGGGHYSRRIVLTLTWKPEVEKEQLLQRLLTVQDRVIQRLDRSLTEYHQRIKDFSAAIERVWKLRRLDLSETLSHIARCILGYRSTISGRVDDSSRVIPFSYSLATEFVGGFAPEVGRQHVRIVALNGIPDPTAVGIAGFLGELEYPYRVSIRVQPLSQSVAAAILRRQRNTHDFQKQSLFEIAAEKLGQTASRFVSKHQVAMAENANDAESDNDSGAVRFCYLSAKVIISDEDAGVADERQQQVFKALLRARFNPRKEWFNATEAWLGSLPGDGYRDLRMPLVSTRTVADLLPLSQPYQGQSTNPCDYYPIGTPALLQASSAGATPFHLYLHVGDVGHTLIVGRTGAGKTVLLGMLLASFRAMSDGQIFVIDKGRGSMALCQRMGGRHYDLSGDLLERWLYGQARMEPDPHLTVWEIDGLWTKQPRHIETFIGQMFDLIEERSDGRPTLVLIDEGWAFLKEQRIEKAFREGRKHNVACVLTTQNATDIYNSTLRDVVLHNTSTKIWLPDATAGTVHGAEIYGKLGLNTQEITEVATRRDKQWYYYTSELGRRWFDLELGPIALSHLTAKGEHEESSDSFIAAAGS